MLDKPCPSDLLQYYHSGDVDISDEHKALYPSLHACAEWDFMVIDRYCHEYKPCRCLGNNCLPYVPALRVYINRALRAPAIRLGSGCAIDLFHKDEDLWSSINTYTRPLGPMGYWNGKDTIPDLTYIPVEDFMSCWVNSLEPERYWDRLALGFINSLPSESLLVLEWE